jgi:hypothetical protein
MKERFDQFLSLACSFWMDRVVVPDGRATSIQHPDFAG